MVWNSWMASSDVISMFKITHSNLSIVHNTDTDSITAFQPTVLQVPDSELANSLAVSIGGLATRQNVTTVEAAVKGCALAIPGIWGGEGGGHLVLSKLLKNFMRFSSRPVYICIVRLQNAIPTNFEHVGPHYISSSHQQVTQDHGRSKQMASCTLNTCCAHLPACFSLYHAFPPLMIDIRL